MVLCITGSSCSHGDDVWSVGERGRSADGSSSYQVAGDDGVDAAGVFVLRGCVSCV